MSESTNQQTWSSEQRVYGEKDSINLSNDVIIAQTRPRARPRGGC